MKKLNLHFWLFIGASIIYLVTRLYKIEDFPIYFFADEAIQAVKAGELIEKGLRSENGQFLPLFFHRFSSLYNLGIAPYFHIPAVIFFGKKIWATRGTIVIVSFIGSVFTSLILKNILKIKHHWLGILFLASSSLYFLFTRSAFEGGITTALYAAFLYFYLLYRTNEPLFLFPSLFLAALTFYSYPGVYIPMLATLFLFFIADFPYHIKHFKITFVSSLLVFLFFLPVLIFRQTHPDLIRNQLAVYDSYLVKDLPYQKKIKIFLSNYSLTFNPKFLFSYHKTYHLRHYVKGRGYFPIWSSPFIALGAIYLLLNIRKPLERTILLALSAAPLGGAITEPGSHRILIISILLALVFSLGVRKLELFWDKYFKNNILGNYLPLFIFLFMVLDSLYLAHYSLKEGPLWFRDYGLYGMQYGAKQIFQERLPKYLQADSQLHIYVSHIWANASDIFPDFFLSREERERVEMKDLQYFLSEKRELDQNSLFVFTSEEYHQAKESNRFKDIKVEEIIPYPDGSQGFYILSLSYRDDAKTLFKD